MSWNRKYKAEKIYKPKEWRAASAIELRDGLEELIGRYTKAHGKLQAETTALTLLGYAVFASNREKEKIRKEKLK